MSRPQLTDSYRKARRSYGLFAALLLAWELVGIRLDPSPLENIDITVESPSAAPFVLVILVLYFAYRFTIEWRQCPNDARSRIASHIDYSVSHSIGIVSLLVFSYQRASGVQIYDYFLNILDNPYKNFSSIALASISCYGLTSDLDSYDNDVSKDVPHIVWYYTSFFTQIFHMFIFFSLFYTYLYVYGNSLLNYTICFIFSVIFSVILRHYGGYISNILKKYITLLYPADE